MLRSRRNIGWIWVRVLLTHKMLLCDLSCLTLWANWVKFPCTHFWVLLTAKHCQLLKHRMPLGQSSRRQVKQWHTHIHKFMRLNSELTIKALWTLYLISTTLCIGDQVWQQEQLSLHSPGSSVFLYEKWLLLMPGSWCKQTCRKCCPIWLIPFGLVQC